ncbi:hypothetical protein [Acidovorax sp. PRC11]|uniref:hypothetical protein n=1 Tax=Acidovorax sp. PRC11 TaxID=2962592 RepID=UPI002880E77F|nr:hypothetical protein [Acidovorax sp. PRC11]MDT0140562.1 hypothetical protein [Acidovorax sp. PRC11]
MIQMDTAPAASSRKMSVLIAIRRCANVQLALCCPAMVPPFTVYGRVLLHGASPATVTADVVDESDCLQ